MNKLYILIVSVLLCSCNKNPQSSLINDSNKNNIMNIDVNEYMKNESFLINDIIDSVKLIFLETTDECIISSINKLIITDDRIFINDIGSAILLDRNGKYIKRMQRGNGPGEIYNVLDIAYDKLKNEYIINQGRTIQRYTPNGDFINDCIMPFFAHTINIIGDTYIFTKINDSNSEECNTIESRWDEYSTIITDDKLNIKNITIPYGTEFIIPKDNIINDYKDSVNIIAPLNDTIYNFANNSLSAKYCINYSSVKKDFSNFKTYDDWREYRRNSKLFDKCNLDNYFENSTHQFFSFTYGLNSLKLFRDKNNDIIQGGAYTIIDDDIFYIPIDNTRYIYNNWFVCFCSYGISKNSTKKNRYLSNEDISRLEKYNENEDNPILVMYKLKPFIKNE